MNLMDECALFACIEETMEIFFSVPPFHANVDYRSKPGERLVRGGFYILFLKFSFKYIYKGHSDNY